LLNTKIKLDIQEVVMQEENSEASPLSVAAKNMKIVDWLGGTLPFFLFPSAAANIKFKRSS
jgi:hypothetical protein